MKAEYKHFYRSRDAPFLLPTDILQGSRQTKGSQFKMDVSKELSTRIEQIVNKDGSHLKATASVTIGGAFAIHGIRIMDSEKGLFVQMPQRSFKREGGQNRISRHIPPRYRRGKSCNHQKRHGSLHRKGQGAVKADPR